MSSGWIASSFCGASSASMKTILELPLSKLADPNYTFDLGSPATPSRATPCRFRFVDTEAFVHSETLRLLETSQLPTERKYAAISYPWAGLSPLEAPRGSFVVAGAESGGPVSIDVLFTTCVAALQDNCTLLWFDRMCILQKKGCDDKDWQIQRMCDVYRGCTTCLALLGGVQRLAGLEDETTWARRAWTLQEALVPPLTRCVFRWVNGTVWVNDAGGPIVEVEPGHSATWELKWLLGRSLRNETKYNFRARTLLTTKVQIIQRSEATALKCAMMDKNSRCAIWRCAIMRTSSRPVDMVFSIMGLFGVELDPREFDDDDRERATLALAQGIMRNGGKADWLGVAFGLGPAKFMSTMAAFPEVLKHQDPVVTTYRGQEMVRDVLDYSWYLADAPIGSVDDEGYLRFSGKAWPICEVPFLGRDSHPTDIVTSPRKTGVPGRQWKVLSARGASATTYAIVVGKMKGFFHAECGTFQLPKDDVVMIVEKMKGGRGFHRIALAVVHAEMIQNWEQQEFSVGGPEKLRPGSRVDQRQPTIRLHQPFSSEVDFHFTGLPPSAPVPSYWLKK